MSAITINGKDYEADLTDLYVVRDIAEAVTNAKAAQQSGDIGDIISFAESAKGAVSRAIGSEQADEAFGDKLVLSVVLDAVNQLSAEALSSYDRMLSHLA